MIIPHPLLGPRDSQEFTYLGDASLIERPDWQAEDAVDQFHDYLYLRDNPAGEITDLWYHELGCSAWIEVTRNTVTHAISATRLLADRAKPTKKGARP